MLKEMLYGRMAPGNEVFPQDRELSEFQGPFGQQAVGRGCAFSVVILI